MFVSSGREWMGASVLSQSAHTYLGYLQRDGYCAATVRAYEHSVGHFARWLTQRRTPLSHVDESLVRRFVTDHPPACRCPAPCQRTEHVVRAALAHLLHVLRAEGGIPGPRLLLPQAIHDELERFNVHLHEVCGLAPSTRTSRRMWVSKFLLHHFGRTPVEIGRLKPRDIANFVVRQTDSYKPGMGAVAPVQERKFLGYRLLLNGKLGIAPKSLERAQDKIRQITRRHRGVSLSQVIAELNDFLAGWFQYYP